MTGLRIFSYALAAVAGLGSGAIAQTPAASSPDNRAQAIAASFSKSKHVVKERRGVRKEKFADVKSVPAVRANPATYSGTYETDFGFSLQLVVSPDGKVEGTGFEPLDTNSGVMQRYTLQNARINGALLTGSKVYANGNQERLEGVFITRTSRYSPTDAGRSEFGLGVLGKPVYVAGHTTDRFFFKAMTIGARE
jgi:hypothetical protein